MHFVDSLDALYSPTMATLADLFKAPCCVSRKRPAAGPTMDQMAAAVQTECRRP